MPRKGKNIEKSEIFFSLQFNDKTDTTCRCSKKKTPARVPVFNFCIFCFFHILLRIYHPVCYRALCVLLPYILPHCRGFFRFPSIVFVFALLRFAACKKTSARASVRQRIFHHVREMTQGQFAVVAQRHQAFRFFPIEEQIRKAQ